VYTKRRQHKSIFHNVASVVSKLELTFWEKTCGLIFQTLPKEPAVAKVVVSLNELDAIASFEVQLIWATGEKFICKQSARLQSKANNEPTYGRPTVYRPLGHSPPGFSTLTPWQFEGGGRIGRRRLTLQATRVGKMEARKPSIWLTVASDQAPQNHCALCVAGRLIQRSTVYSDRVSHTDVGECFREETGSAITVVDHERTV
jgi:hypothetical protein